jgi:hypothetical protein
MGMVVFIARVFDRLLVYFRCAVLSIYLTHLTAHAERPEGSRNLGLSSAQASRQEHSG